MSDQLTSWLPHGRTRPLVRADRLAGQFWPPRCRGQCAVRLGNPVVIPVVVAGAYALLRRMEPKTAAMADQGAARLQPATGVRGRSASGGALMMGRPASGLNRTRRGGRPRAVTVADQRMGRSRVPGAAGFGRRGRCSAPPSSCLRRGEFPAAADAGSPSGSVRIAARIDSTASPQAAAVRAELTSSSTSTRTQSCSHSVSRLVATMGAPSCCSRHGHEAPIAWLLAGHPAERPLGENSNHVTERAGVGPSTTATAGASMPSVGPTSPHTGFGERHVRSTYGVRASSRARGYGAAGSAPHWQ